MFYVSPGFCGPSVAEGFRMLGFIVFFVDFLMIVSVLGDLVDIFLWFYRVL